MKILMLVNWKIEYVNEKPVDKQPPDYVVYGEKYWFFRYMPENVIVDVVDVHSFPALENLEKNKIRFYIWQTLKILPKLKRYDIVLSHGMQSGIVLCLLRRLFGKGNYKHITFDIGAFNSAKESGSVLKLMQFASKSLDGVIYHTAAQKYYYRSCHPWLLDKSEYIPFGTDTEFFAVGTAESNKTVTEISASEKRQYILCIGSSKRDWVTLIKAYKILRQRLGNIKIPELRLIGNRNAGISDDDIKVMESITITQLICQIENALFGVLPLKSFNYSYGQMTLLQQMSLEKAVIAADVPSIRDYISNGTDALLYEPENERQLAALMEELICNADKRETIEKNAGITVKNKWNEKNMAEAIWEFIKRYGVK